MSLGGARQIGIAAAIMAGGFLTSRVLGLVRNMVLGAAFGAGPALDAYFAAFRIPDLIFQLTAAAAMGSAFVPVFSAYLARGQRDDAWKVASSLLTLVFLVASGVALAGFVAAPALIPLLTPGFPPATMALTVNLTRLMLLSAVLFSVSGIITGILNSHRHFLLPALAPLAYNAAIIGGAVGLGGPLGIYGPAVGVVAGAGLHLLIQAAGLPFRELRGILTPRLRHPGVLEVARLTGPRVLGLAAMHGNFVVITVLASGLAAGSLGALTYGWALMMVPMGVFGMALATAVFPALAEMAATDRRDALRDTIAAGTRYLLFLNVPAGVGLMVLAGPLVRLLFRRGQFTSEAADATAAAVACYGLGLFSFAALEVITRGFYALRDTVTPLLFGAVALALNLSIGLALMGPLGIAGLALGHALSTVLEFFLMYEVLRRRLDGLHTPALLTSAARTLAASGAMAAAVLALRAAADDGRGSSAALLVLVTGGMVVGAAVFLAVSWALGSAEARALAGQARGRGKGLVRTAALRVNSDEASP